MRTRPLRRLPRRSDQRVEVCHSRWGRHLAKLPSAFSGVTFGRVGGAMHWRFAFVAIVLVALLPIPARAQLVDAHTRTEALLFFRAG